jgi:DUF1680 family protein
VPSDLYRYEPAPDSGYAVHVNGERVVSDLAAGYLAIERTWKDGDVVELDLQMPVRHVRGHEQVQATRGRVALERGPLVYCVEGMDASTPLADLCLAPETRISVLERPELLGGIVALRVETPGLAAFECVPYFAWNNRGLAPMTVWMRALT